MDTTRSHLHHGMTHFSCKLSTPSQQCHMLRYVQQSLRPSNILMYTFLFFTILSKQTYFIYHQSHYLRVYIPIMVHQLHRLLSPPQDSKICFHIYFFLSILHIDEDDQRTGMHYHDQLLLMFLTISNRLSICASQCQDMRHLLCVPEW